MTPLVVATPMVVVQAVAERRALDPAGFARLTAGRLPGTVLGAWVLTRRRPVGRRRDRGRAAALRGRGERAARRALDLAAAGGRRRLRVGRGGTVGAVGGPYMGLAYADRPGPVMRATISLAFAAGLVISLAAIGIAGQISPPECGSGPGSCRSRSSACGRACGSRARSTAARCAPRCWPSQAPQGRSRSCAPCSDAGSVDGVRAVLRLPGVRSLFAVQLHRAAADGRARAAADPGHARPHGLVRQRRPRGRELHDRARVLEPGARALGRPRRADARPARRRRRLLRRDGRRSRCCRTARRRRR